MRNILISCLSYMPEDQMSNPDMCPDWELNQQTFALWDDVQPTEPHGSGPHSRFLMTPVLEDIRGPLWVGMGWAGFLDSMEPFLGSML